MFDPDSLAPPARRRLDIARRVAEAHRPLDDGSLLAFVSGSTVEDLCDERSDVDMSVVLDAPPGEAALRAACRQVGGEWTWSAGRIDEGLVVAFAVDEVEVQIGYSSHAVLQSNLDELLVRHTADTPNHKLAEGILKAVPLAGDGRFAALRARLEPFPPELGRAMVEHGLATPVPWRAIGQLLHRDATLWCRELQVDACYRLLLMLCGLNGRYFTRFQLKRMHRLAAGLPLAPPALAGRIEALLAAPARLAFDELHRLEGETLDLLALHRPGWDLAAARRRHAAYAPSWT